MSGPGLGAAGVAGGGGACEACESRKWPITNIELQNWRYQKTSGFWQLRGHTVVDPQRNSTD